MEYASEVSTDRPAPVSRGSNRGWLWIVLLVVLAGGCTCSIGCGGIFALVFGILRNSTPYQMALREAQNDEQLQARLGEPIVEASWFPMGNISRGGGRGNASLSFDVSGPEGRATIYVDAQFEAGQWRLTRLDADVQHRERLTLVPSE